MVNSGLLNKDFVELFLVKEKLATSNPYRKESRIPYLVRKRMYKKEKEEPKNQLARFPS